MTISLLEYEIDCYVKFFPIVVTGAFFFYGALFHGYYMVDMISYGEYYPEMAMFALWVVLSIRKSLITHSH